MDLTGLLHGAYVVAAVFGFGVMAVDMLGLLGDHNDGGHDGDGGLHDGGGHHGDGANHHLSGDTDTHGSAGHSSILVLLSRIRLAVYFCAGFGAAGLAAEITGSGTLTSLLWGLAAGVLSTLLARAMFRIQRRDVDSSLNESELLAQPATVIVPLSATDMGKVRMRMGQLTVERYALGEDPDDSFASNDSVEIVRITPEHVYVRRIHTDR